MKHLVVSSDDFGMCHSVNTGVVRGFREGVLTQSTLMMPCPWAPEAVALAKEYHIPVGVHLTAICEWDHYRWRPLTRVASFVAADGTFLSDTRYVQAHADRGELEAEFAAQIEAVLACGVQPTHLDSHCAVMDVDVLARLCRRYGIPTRNLKVRDKAPDTVFALTSPETCYSARPDKKPLMRQYLEGLSDGHHAFIVHAAEPSGELAAMSSRPAGYAQPYRVSDLALILDPEVRQWCDELGVNLVPFSECPVQRHAQETGWVIAYIGEKPGHLWQGDGWEDVTQ